MPYSQQVYDQQKSLNQANLTTPGYNPIAVDGYLGTQTQNAFAQYGVPGINMVNGSPVIPTSGPLGLNGNGNQPPLPSANQQPPTYTPTSPVLPTGTAMSGTTTGAATGVAPFTPNLNASRSDRLQAAHNALLGKSPATQALEQNNGESAIRTNIANLQGQYVQQQAVSDNTEAIYRNGAITSSAIATGRVARIQALEGAKLGIISAQILAAQGNLKQAEDEVDRAIKFQFGPAQQEIDNLKEFQTFANNDLTESEKIKLTAEINKQSQDHADITSAMSDAMKLAVKNGAPAGVITAIGNAKTPEEVYLALGTYGADESGGTIVKINGIDYVQNSDGSFSVPNVPGATQNLTTTADQIDTIAGLLGNKMGFRASVGTTSLFGRGGNFDFGSARQSFNASTQQLISQLSLDSLIKAKAQGATFGALSDTELKILASSATKLDTWAIKDKDGNIKGYKTSQANVRNELQRISDLAKRDFLLKGGKPEDIGATAMPDGKVYSKNPDGTIQEIYSPTDKVSIMIPSSSKLAYTNNNPGNLRFVGQAGATQGQGGFAKFSSPQAGVEALKRQIAMDASRGHTLQSFISKYAPPSENNTAQYIIQVSAMLGIAPTAKISTVDINRLVRAIALKESGTKIG